MIKICVCMITYGHEQFIEEAIGGVLMQKCNYDIELVVVNDCSPDKTDSLILKILENHPKASCIKYIKQEKNLGMMPNFIFAVEQCEGDYIAICEGDDYWTDPLKLQKQVDVLENNNDCVISFTQSDILFPGEGIKIGYPYHKPLKTSYENIVLGNYISTLTVVFRRPLNGLYFSAWFVKSSIGDWPLYLWLTKDGGKIHHLPDITGVYRLGVGVSSEFNKKPFKMNAIETYILESILTDTEFSVKKEVTQKALAIKLSELAGIYNSKKQYLQSLKPLLKSLNYHFSFDTIKIYLYSIKKSLRL